MLHPSYTDLINVVNKDIEPGEQPVVQSRYSIVIAASKRARQLIAGDDAMVAGAAGKKPLSIAIDELYQQKVKILPEEEPSAEEELDTTEEEALDFIKAVCCTVKVQRMAFLKFIQIRSKYNTWKKSSYFAYL